MRKKHISIQVPKLCFERRLSNPFLWSMAAAKIRLESQTAGSSAIGQQPQMLQGESHHPAHERLYLLPDSQASDQVWPDTRASAFLETVDSNKNLFGLRIPRYFCQNFFRIAPQSSPFPTQPLSLPLRSSRLDLPPGFTDPPASSGYGLFFHTLGFPSYLAQLSCVSDSQRIWTNTQWQRPRNKSRCTRGMK